MAGQGRVLALAEGSLLAALAAVLALAGLYIPPLQIITNMVWTVPIVVAVVRWGLRLGLMTTLVAGLLVAILIGPVQSVLLFLQFAGVGLVYGYLFRRAAPAGRTLALGALVALVSLAATLLASLSIAGLPLAGLWQEMDAALDATLAFYQRAGIMKSLEAQGMTPEQFKATLAQTLKWLRLLLPGIMAAVALVYAFMNFLVARAILARLKLATVFLPAFRYWQLPWYINWGVIVGLSLWLWGDSTGREWVAVAGANVLYFYVPLLFVNGLAAAVFLHQRLAWPPLFKAVTVLLLAMYLPLTFWSVMALGLFDPFLSYRRLANAGGEEGED